MANCAERPARWNSRARPSRPCWRSPIAAAIGLRQRRRSEGGTRLVQDEIADWAGCLHRFQAAEAAPPRAEDPNPFAVPLRRMQLLLHAPVPGMLFRLAAPNVAATVMMTAVTTKTKTTQC